MKIRIAALAALALTAGACAQTGSGGYFRPDIKDTMTARIIPGQPEADVLAILGQPYRKIRFNNLNATAWDYMYQDTFGYWVAFSVMVNDNHRVVNKVSVRLDPPGPN